MTALINNGAETISTCELEGVLEANHWKFIDKNNNNIISPQPPSIKYISCKD